ncbi:uncharacterized protein LOC120350639 [Nilaparvata lugens]|uniref:uncharacterized protein LOC120350639 n=1 Tax=Nilaparvata lugens TaxID=108931 RepID=UPI00193E444C|nr:uncharacterized protein LOC120350639 [Nilaparvata lugens]
MLAVRYPDGVTIARHEISREDLSPNPSNTASVTEIIYLDPWSSKVLKYEGDMREIGIPDKTTKSDNAAPAPKTENSRIKKNPCAAFVQRLLGCWKSKEENGGK